MENEIKIVYGIVAVIFVVLQGFCWSKWWSTSRDVELIEYIKQTLLNTLGSIIGWVSGYYLVFYRLYDLNNVHFVSSDFVLFLLFFYGANGRLPDILINRVMAVIDKVSSKF